MTITELPRTVPTVAFVDHSTERGGAELALLRLLNVAPAWRPVLVAPPGEDSTDDVFAVVPPGTTAVRIGPRHTARRVMGQGAGATVTLAGKLFRSAVSLTLSRRVRPVEVLVANTTRASVYVTMAALLLRRPVVVHVRDLIEPEAIGGAASALMRRFVLPRAAGVIANSQASLALVEPHIREHCVRAVLPSPSGIRPAAVAPEVGPVNRIGMVARIDPWKGQELLLRAFADACTDSDTQLVFFGSAAFGNEGFVSELEELATRLGVADRVEFAGHVEDVAAAIRSLDICVQASIRPEPLGQNVLQYLAAGKATVVSGEGGPAEWITDGENGCIFTPRDQQSLAAALRRLQSDSELRASVAQRAPMTPGLLTDEQIRDKIGALLAEVVGS